MRLSNVCLVFALLAAGTPALAEGPSSSATLHALFDREWQRGAQEDPVSASLRGEREYNDLWPDISPEAAARSHAADQQALADLAKIDRTQLPKDDQVSYDLFKWDYEDRLQSYSFKEYQFPLTLWSGIQTEGDIALDLRFTTLKDYQDWLKRLHTFGPYMDQTIAWLQQGVDEGRTFPRVVSERIAGEIDPNIVSDPTQSPFYSPFLKQPDSVQMDPKAWAAMQAEAKDAIRTVEIPAFQRLQKFFHDVYLPKSRVSLGASDLPDGKAYYAYLVRRFTTTDMTPEQVHELGLKKIAEIHQQMLDVIAQAKFKGSLQDFLKYLRTSKKFHYKNPDDLLAAYKAEAKTIDPLLVKEFGREPRVPWGIAVIPADQAPSKTPAYSNPPSGDGTTPALMYVNLYKPETRPTYEIPVLTCHEGRPGHAMQIPLAMEMTNLPEFRRYGYFNVYGEGWALYSETLCDEMGLYDDPYKKFGMLSYQMWRAVRLVVDTGIHYYGMSRADAVQMFKDNTALTDQNIGTEVDRYISWPGQALSYMIGEIKIQELSKRAEDKLGPKFDKRAFHDVILENGTVPLNVLDTVVNDWIDEQLKPQTDPSKTGPGIRG